MNKVEQIIAKIDAAFEAFVNENDLEVNTMIGIVLNFKENEAINTPKLSSSLARKGYSIEQKDTIEDGVLTDMQLKVYKNIQ